MRKRFFIVITIFTIIIVLSTPIVFAKYIIAEKINSSFDIATPIFIVEGEDITQISENNNIGYYEFSIKNYDGTNISGTSFLYTIEVIADTEAILQFELYNEEKQISLENLKSEKISIDGNEKIEQKYKLKIIYDCSNESNNKSIIGEVQIKIYSEQKRD